MWVLAKMLMSGIQISAEILSNAAVLVGTDVKGLMDRGLGLVGMRNLI